MTLKLLQNTLSMGFKLFFLQRRKSTRFQILFVVNSHWKWKKIHFDLEQKDAKPLKIDLKVFFSFSAA